MLNRQNMQRQSDQIIVIQFKYDSDTDQLSKYTGKIGVHKRQCLFTALQ